jgi:hypothetical protein
VGRVGDQVLGDQGAKWVGVFRPQKQAVEWYGEAIHLHDEHPDWDSTEPHEWEGHAHQADQDLWSERVPTTLLTGMTRLSILMQELLFECMSV